MLHRDVSLAQIGPAVRSAEEAPRNRAELRAWLRAHFELELPHAPMVEGHASPLDYLTHAFFQGREGFGSAPGEMPDCVLWGSRGGGKTFLGAVATALDLLFKPGIEIRILGGSMDQSKRMHAHLKRLFARQPFDAMVKGRVGESKITLINGSEVELLAQSQASVRGTRVQTLRCDEVELFKEEIFEAAMLTTRSRSVDVPGYGRVELAGCVECLSTLHRSYGVMHRLVLEKGRRQFKWGVLDVLGRCGDGRKCEEIKEDGRVEACKLWDECRGKAKQREGNATGVGLGHVEIEDAVRMKSRVSLPAWEAEMLCIRPSRRFSVFGEFDKARHVIEGWEREEDFRVPPGTDLPQAPGMKSAAEKRARLVCGIDFGFRSPTVVLWGVHDLETDILRVLDEREVVEESTRDHGEAIRKGNANRWRWPEWLGVDPAGAAEQTTSATSDIKILRAMGFRVKWRSMRVEESVELVRARLRPADGGSPRLLVHARCERLIRCLDTHHYDPDKDANVRVKDGTEHAVDALRYLVANVDREGTKWWFY